MIFGQPMSSPSLYTHQGRERGTPTPYDFFIQSLVRCALITGSVCAAHIIEENIVKAKMTSWRQDPDELFTPSFDTLANASSYYAALI